MRRPILNNPSPGQAAFEPFMGSGTTLIPAEITGHVCLSEPSVCRADGGKQRDAVDVGFGTFRTEFRKGLDRFRTSMTLVWQVCLVNQVQRNRP
jgi:hypothetical protein